MAARIETRVSLAELIAGLSRFKPDTCPGLNLAFFTWHDRIEDQHAAHTQDELAALMESDGFDSAAFVMSAREAMDAVAGFWEGLLAQQRQHAVQESVAEVDALVG